jgi:hypothetical protein
MFLCEMMARVMESNGTDPALDDRGRAMVVKNKIAAKLILRMVAPNWWIVSGK